MNGRVEAPKTGEESADRVKVLHRLEDSALRVIGDNLATFDRSILTLSSGFLAISVGFVADIGGAGSNPHRWALYTSWVLFGLAIVCSLLGQLVAVHLILSRFKKTEKYLFEEGEPVKVTPKSMWVLNGPTALFFLGAVIFTIYFAICTLSGSTAH